MEGRVGREVKEANAETVYLRKDLKDRKTYSRRRLERKRRQDPEPHGRVPLWKEEGTDNMKMDG